MKLEVKVCGLKEQIREICACGPDYVGLIYHANSPRHLPLSALKACRSRVSRSIPVVLVVRDEEMSVLDELIFEVEPAIVQLHGEESEDFCVVLKERFPTLKIWKAVQVSAPEDLSLLTSDTICSAYLFDSASTAGGGTGKKFHWEYLDAYRANIPFFLSGGIGLDDIPEILKLPARYPLLQGIDVNSRFEEAPGKKDVAQIQACVELVRENTE